MKVEVFCSECDKSFLVDEHADEGEVFCPGCCLPVRAAPEHDRPARTAPAMPAAAAVAATPAAPTGSPVAEEIVCPRCKLHFRPRVDSVDVQPSGELPTVLVVEDMGYFREIAKDTLAGTCNVRTASTVAEAREAIRGGGIDLILLDLTLEDGERGADVLRGLPSKPCPVLIFTAQDESEMYGDCWDELRALGADDIVMKGMNVGESLLKKVGSLLGKSWDEENLIEQPPDC